MGSSPTTATFVLERDKPHSESLSLMYYDESTNPSNGWDGPNFEEDNPLRGLEPGEDNPLDSGPIYNPLNHAYPMVADTAIGQVEIMVKFAIVRGKENLPIDLINQASELQVPMAIEDVPVSETGDTFQVPEDIFENKPTPSEIVAESALVDELTQDQTYYLIPTIVRARRLIGPQSENILGAEGGDLISAEETAELIPPSALLDLLIMYHDKVAADPEAPKALLDLLGHFVDKNGPSTLRHIIDDFETDEEFTDEE